LRYLIFEEPLTVNFLPVRMFVILREVAQDYPDVIETSLANARSKKIGSRREALFAAFKAKVEE